jgi:hypothetical protein
MTPRRAATARNLPDPSRASRAGSVSSPIARRPTLVSNRLDTHPARPGKARSTWPSSWCLVAVRTATRRARWATRAASQVTAWSTSTWPRGTPWPASSRSPIATRSTGSVLTPRRPRAHRWVVTCAGFSSISCQSAGSTPALTSGRWSCPAASIPTRTRRTGRWTRTASTRRTSSATPGRVMANSNGRTSSSPAKSHTSAIAWCLPTSIGTATSWSGGSRGSAPPAAAPGRHGRAP